MPLSANNAVAASLLCAFCASVRALYTEPGSVAWANDNPATAIDAANANTLTDITSNDFFIRILPARLKLLTINRRIYPFWFAHINIALKNLLQGCLSSLPAHQLPPHDVQRLQRDQVARDDPVAQVVRRENAGCGRSRRYGQMAIVIDTVIGQLRQCRVQVDQRHVHVQRRLVDVIVHDHRSMRVSRVFRERREDRDHAAVEAVLHQTPNGWPKIWRGDQLCVGKTDHNQRDRRLIHSVIAGQHRFALEAKIPTQDCPAWLLKPYGSHAAIAGKALDVV